MTVLNRNGQSGKSSQNKEVTQVLLIVISWIKKWFCVHKCVLIMGKKKPKKNKEEQRKTKEKQRK